MVYVGRGETRTAQAPLFALTSWTHLAATYDGAELNVYVDGKLKASQAFSEPRPIHESPYAHPITVGHGFR